jgi:hypothetical protein
VQLLAKFAQLFSNERALGEHLSCFLDGAVTQLFLALGPSPGRAAEPKSAHSGHARIAGWRLGQAPLRLARPEPSPGPGHPESPS